ncbi:hypothetical protein QBC32DRAFT_312577 [Pseudoneurospora amorphoporcata]|uniref:Heterokaryon incompatibility domain-containing protein n=1 Tax=Pseudoneurospora amorphoporcata TaxID=241081 RepID=A0AAN6P1B4_9PEZI|nr:hypothetical protein QBC32DRAFT_312577 [Pseudoneurospora amorphoporcata]
MRITHEPGYRYIWIDSLCIIQDSRKDWEREGVTLAEVYGNCVVGIAALGCGTGEDADRCFTERNPLEVIPYKIGPKPDETRTPCWVFQERVLSSGVLFFGDSQLYWECRRTTMSESYPINDTWRSHNITCKTQVHAFCGGADNDWKTSDNDENGNSNSSNTSLIPCIPDDLTLTKPCRYYLALLESYTSTSLTYPLYRLIALSGIITVILHPTNLHPRLSSLSSRGSRASPTYLSRHLRPVLPLPSPLAFPLQLPRAL